MDGLGQVSGGFADGLGGSGDGLNGFGHVLNGFGMVWIGGRMVLDGCTIFHNFSQNTLSSSMMNLRIPESIYNS